MLHPRHREAHASLDPSPMLNPLASPRLSALDTENTRTASHTSMYGDGRRLATAATTQVACCGISVATRPQQLICAPRPPTSLA